MPTVRRDGIEIRYELVGSGPPVVLLHSFLCSGSMWAGQLDALARQYRVINVDARGHGKSGRAHAPFSLYDAMHDVVAVLDAVGVERCVWAGLSVGGMVALRAALREPHRVAGLILLDTSAGVDPPWRRIKLELLGVAARAVGLRPLIPQAAREMFGITSRRHRPELVRGWVEAFVNVDVVSALNTLRAFVRRDDLLPRLREITVPAAVLVGTEDRPQPPRVARQLADGLPHAVYEEIPGAGHLSALERPEAVTEIMMRYLREHGRHTD